MDHGCHFAVVGRALEDIFVQPSVVRCPLHTQKLGTVDKVRAFRLAKRASQNASDKLVERTLPRYCSTW